VPLGLLAVWNAVSRTRAEGLALAAVVTGWIGVGLTLPYFGAEDFGLNAIARKAAQGQVMDLLGLVDAVRFSPVPATTFAVGLLLVGAGAVLAAVAIWRSRVLARASGILFAAGFVLFLPQFFTPPAVRIAHGVLVAAGSIWVALALWRASAAMTEPGQGVAATDRPGRARAWPWRRPLPLVSARAVGFAAAAWVAPGGGTGDPGPLGPAARLTRPQAGPVRRQGVPAGAPCIKARRARSAICQAAACLAR
jgi:hypothetical protein